MAEQPGRVQAIREIQVYLKELSREYHQIPMVAVDGVYEERTREAVKAFQRLFALEETGVVNYDTWTALVREYMAHRRRRDPPRPVPFLYGRWQLLRVGSTGDAVQAARMMLNAVAGLFSNIPPVPPSAAYSERMAQSVRIVQSVSGLSPTGEVDVQTWNSLARIYRSYQRSGRLGR